MFRRRRQTDQFHQQNSLSSLILILEAFGRRLKANRSFICHAAPHPQEWLFASDTAAALMAAQVMGTANSADSTGFDKRWVASQPLPVRPLHLQNGLIPWIQGSPWHGKVQGTFGQMQRCWVLSSEVPGPSLAVLRRRRLVDAAEHPKHFCCALPSQRRKSKCQFHSSISLLPKDERLPQSRPPIHARRNRLKDPCQARQRASQPRDGPYVVSRRFVHSLCFRVSSLQVSLGPCNPPSSLPAPG
jgi:hypothetical protein